MAKEEHMTRDECERIHAPITTALEDLYSKTNSKVPWFVFLILLGIAIPAISGAYITVFGYSQKEAEEIHKLRLEMLSAIGNLEKELVLLNERLDPSPPKRNPGTSAVPIPPPSGPASSGTAGKEPLSCDLPVAPSG